MIPSDEVAFSSTEILSMRIKELVMQVMEATVDLKNQNKPIRERESKTFWSGRINSLVFLHSLVRKTTSGKVKNFLEEIVDYDNYTPIFTNEKGANH